MFKFKILHAKVKTLSLLTTLAAFLSAVALPIVPKVEFNFEVLQSGADPGFFLGGGATLRNDVTDR